ncbi:hypothetical protein Hanom_Chr08g00703371 [Helianthus anomalus]
MKTKMTVFCHYRRITANNVVVIEWLGKYFILLVTQVQLSLCSLIIFYGIQLKGKCGWRRFILDGRRGFTDYSTVMSTDGWRSAFHASWRAKGLETVE